MSPNAPKRRWYRLSPDRFMAGLILVVGLLWLSERFGWFGFNDHKGWPLLIALAAVAVWAVVAVLGCVAGLLFRRRVQFSVRSLLIFVLAVSIAFGWLAAEMRSARRQADLIRDLDKSGGRVFYSYEWDGERSIIPREPSPTWLRNLFGIDYFAKVNFATVQANQATDAESLRDAVEQLSNLPGLQTLHLGDATDFVLTHLSGPSNLRVLVIHGDGDSATDEGWRALENFPHLEELTLAGPIDGNSALPHIKNLTALKKLELDGIKVTDAGIKNLDGLVHIEDLLIHDGGGPQCCDAITTVGWQTLSRLHNLKHLCLEGHDVTNAVLRNLTGLSDLSILELEDTSINDDELPRLRRLKSLEALRLDGEGVTDEGLENVVGLPRLKWLGLEGHSFTLRGIEKLRAAMPNLQISPPSTYAN